MLVLYPKEFCDAYGPQMVQVFRDACRETVYRAGIAGLVALWARATLDLLFAGLAERRRASTTSSGLKRLERVLERALLLGSPWQAHTSRSWAVGAVLAGSLNVAINMPFLLYVLYDAGRGFPVYLPVGGLALGLMLICQGAGYLLRVRSETFARLLRVGSVLVFGSVALVCTVALLISLLGPVGALWRAAGMLAVALLLYGAIKLLPSRWQVWLFGEDDMSQG